MLGADLDNVLVCGRGLVMRIDQGGALRFRAQGSLKTDFGPEVIEFETLRDPKRNAVAASVFGAMSREQLLASLQRVVAIEAGAIRDTVLGVYGAGANADELGRASDRAARRSRPQGSRAGGRLIAGLGMRSATAYSVRRPAKDLSRRGRRNALLMRTSASHPLQIAAVSSGPGHGRIGLTFCPGKYDAHAASGAWNRDLATDLDMIRDWGAAAVVTLVEARELTMLRVERLGEEVLCRQMAWYHLPIVDVSTPDQSFEIAWRDAGEGLRAILRSGFDVVVHCRGGLGRAGTIAARLMAELGVAPIDAVKQVRKARPGAIETPNQKRYVLEVQPAPERSPDVDAIRDRAHRRAGRACGRRRGRHAARIQAAR